MPFIQQDNFDFLAAWPIDGLKTRIDEEFMQTSEKTTSPLHQHTKQTFRPNQFPLPTLFGTVKDGGLNACTETNAQTTTAEQPLEYDPVRILPNADPPKRYYRRTDARRSMPPEHSMAKASAQMVSDEDRGNTAN